MTLKEQATTINKRTKQQTLPHLLFQHRHRPTSFPVAPSLREVFLMRNANILANREWTNVHAQVKVCLCHCHCHCLFEIKTLCSTCSFDMCFVSNSIEICVFSQLQKSFLLHINFHIPNTQKSEKFCIDPNSSFTFPTLKKVKNSALIQIQDTSFNNCEFEYK